MHKLLEENCTRLMNIAERRLHNEACLLDFDESEAFDACDFIVKKYLDKEFEGESEALLAIALAESELHKFIEKLDSVSNEHSRLNGFDQVLADMPEDFSSWEEEIEWGNFFEKNEKVKTPEMDAMKEIWIAAGGRDTQKLAEAISRFMNI